MCCENFDMVNWHDNADKYTCQGGYTTTWHPCCNEKKYVREMASCNNYFTWHFLHRADSGALPLITSIMFHREVTIVLGFIIIYLLMYKF